jgi:hypothetical protein
MNDEQKSSGYEQCHENHTAIMNELADIQKRMDKDGVLIEASRDDLNFRNKLWNILKWLGPLTLGAFLTRFYEYFVT